MLTASVKEVRLGTNIYQTRRGLISSDGSYIRSQMRQGRRSFHSFEVSNLFFEYKELQLDVSRFDDVFDRR